MDVRSLRVWVLPYAPLALHIVPTLFIGFVLVIPGSPIEGFNQYTIGFALAVLGFIPAYAAGLRLAQDRGGAPRG